MKKVVSTKTKNTNISKSSHRTPSKSKSKEVQNNTSRTVSTVKARDYSSKIRNRNVGRSKGEDQISKNITGYAQRAMSKNTSLSQSQTNLKKSPTISTQTKSKNLKRVNSQIAPKHVSRARKTAVVSKPSKKDFQIVIGTPVKGQTIGRTSRSQSVAKSPAKSMKSQTKSLSRTPRSQEKSYVSPSKSKKSVQSHQLTPKSSSKSQRSASKNRGPSSSSKSGGTLKSPSKQSITNKSPKHITRKEQYSHSKNQKSVSKSRERSRSRHRLSPNKKEVQSNQKSPGRVSKQSIKQNISMTKQRMRNLRDNKDDDMPYHKRQHDKPKKKQNSNNQTINRNSKTITPSKEGKINTNKRTSSKVVARTSNRNRNHTNDKISPSKSTPTKTKTPVIKIEHNASKSSQKSISARAERSVSRKSTNKTKGINKKPKSTSTKNRMTTSPKGVKSARHQIKQSEESISITSPSISESSSEQKIQNKRKYVASEAVKAVSNKIKKHIQASDKQKVGRKKTDSEDSESSGNINAARKSLVKTPMKQQFAGKIDTQGISDEISKIIKRIEEKKRQSAEKDGRRKDKKARRRIVVTQNNRHEETRTAKDYNFTLQHNPNIKVNHIININDVIVKPIIKNTDIFLTLLEVAVNHEYYNLTYSTKAKTFWEDVMNYKEMKQIFGDLKSETLRKYWQMISNMETDPEKIADLVKRDKKIIEDHNVKLMTILFAVRQFFKGESDTFEECLKNMSISTTSRQKLIEEFEDPSTGITTKKTSRVLIQKKRRRFSSPIRKAFVGVNFRGPIDEVFDEYFYSI